MTTIMIMTTIMTDTESLPEGWLFFRPASGGCESALVWRFPQLRGGRLMGSDGLPVSL